LAAYSAAERGVGADALKYLERGKARILAHRLSLDRAAFHRLDATLQARYRKQIDILTDLEYRLHQQGLSPEAYLDRVSDLKNERIALDAVIREIRNSNPEFLQRDVAAFTAVQSVIPDRETVFAALCVTDHGSALLTVPHPDRMDTGWTVCRTIPGFTTRDASRLNRQWLTVCNTLKVSRRTAEDIAAFETGVTKVISELYPSLFRELDRAMHRHGIRRMVLAPHGFLNVLPLHLIRDDAGAHLFEKYEITYVPSASAWYHVEVSTREHVPDIDHFLGIANPTGDLQFANAEIRSAARYFGSSQMLSGEMATSDAVLAESSGATVFHAACHGIFDQSNPEKTGLVLAAVGNDNPPANGSDSSMANDAAMSPDRAVFFTPGSSPSPSDRGNVLTLTDISHRLDLRRARLAVLSACESGLVITGQASDEVIGLPAAFLRAGADAVISSLWLVDDARSRDLIDAFYVGYRQQRMSPAAALRSAQCRMLAEGIGFYYWGGFVVTGGLKNCF
ncbi:MAG TPA: CHAT domain-containing protein, partial [bacterium]|nr:CHAT domain-containing protein [bacterium]